MSFEPLNNSISKETFKSASGFSLSTQQVIENGVLKLRGTPVVSPNPDLNWQEATWSETSNFRLQPSRAAPGNNWDHETTVPSLTSDLAAGLFPFTDIPLRQVSKVSKERIGPFHGGPEARRSMRIRDPYILDPGNTEDSALRTGQVGRQLLGRRRIDRNGAAVLKLTAEVGETNFIRQNTSEDQSFWPDNVNNSVGWTAEFRAFVPSGTSELIFDDGDVRVGIYIDRRGLLLETSSLGPSMTRVLSVPWNDTFHKVRVGAQGNNVFLLSDRGQSFVGTSVLTATPSVAKDLQMGFLGTTTGTILIDYFHQSHFGVFMDVEDDIYYTVDTSESFSLTPSLKHAQRVGQFRTAIIKTEGPYTGGTAKVLPQFKNTSNPSWTDFGAAVTMVNPIQEISLTALGVDTDGSDELRFKLLQQPLFTSSRPASFDEITVLTDFDGQPEFRCIPDHGDSSGGNTVRILALNGSDLSLPLTIYISGVAISADKVTAISSSELSVSDWPAGTPGPVTVSIDTLAPGLFFAEKPYRYVESYTKVVDRAEQLARVCGTRSAFRIKNEVPNGEVNLAYVSTPGIETNSHVGLIDLSYLESGNVVGGSAQPTLLDGSALVVPGSTFTYSEPPSTDDLVIAIGAAGWRDLGAPAPLYYYHLIGKGRYYIHKEQDDLSLKELRDSITVHYQDGSPVAIQDFPWDIVVVQKDIRGNDLPINTYLALLLTNKKFIPGKTVFITATVADPSNEMRLIQGYTEVVNAYPIFTKDTQGNLTYDVDITTHGIFTLNIRAK
jgi:hypothetical protein